MFTTGIRDYMRIPFHNVVVITGRERVSVSLSARSLQTAAAIFPFNDIIFPTYNI